MAIVNSWTTAAIAKLKTLFDKGLSTAEIGKRLGFTKNAIVGKINRLGLNSKGAKTKKPKPAPKKKPEALPKKPNVKKTAPKKEADKKRNAKTARESKQRTERIIRHSAQLMGLRADQCRWPIGDPDSDDFRFCGEKCFTGKPYCFEHCKIAYQFTTPIRKK
ncbi:MAG: GcrA family cell cycle regulator [Rickettsiales bacterium]|jgi:GcrA cell cycle regulator|nr:GcrA family cell cycle regulator [Rickettsiales bacterium]